MGGVIDETYDPSTDPNKKEVTVQDILDAIAKNGWTKGKGDFIHWKDSNILEVKDACAIGQAGLNLGVTPESIYDGLNSFDYYEEDSVARRWGDDIASLNDSAFYMPLFEIVRIIKADMEMQKVNLNQKLWVSKWNPDLNSVTE